MKSLTPELRKHVTQWNSLLQSVRNSFARQGVLEVQTPTLVPSPGVEAHLEGFQTEFSLGKRKQLLYLPTSPEFHLKKIVFSGWTDVFEIKTCFRNGELSEHHQPEFTMLEWYRAHDSLNAMIEESIALIFSLCDDAKVTRPKVVRTTFQKLFQKVLGFELTPNTTAAELKSLCEKEGIHLSGENSWNELFFLLLIDKIEPSFAKNVLTVVENFPVSQAALAQIKDGWAQRFEMFWQGLELCNAYQELLDPAEQKRRWTAINSEREALGRKSVTLDDELLQVMQGWNQPICGNAMGLDRVYMAIHGVTRIEDLRIFPIATEIKS